MARMQYLGESTVGRPHCLTDKVVDVRMPRSGCAHTGILHRFPVGDWHHVREGDVVAEVEIDKAIIDITSPIHGWVCRVAHESEGTEVPVGTRIARIRS